MGHPSLGVDIFSAGDFYFTREMDGEGESLEEQAHHVLGKLKTLLDSQRLSVRNIVKVQLYLKDMMDYVDFNKVYAEFMGDHRPPRSAVEVPGFLTENARVKLGVIACRREKIDVFKVPSINPSPGPLYDGVVVEPYLFTREMCGLGAALTDQIRDGFRSMEAILAAKGLSMRDSAVVFAYLTDMRDYREFMDFYGKLFGERLPPLALASANKLPHISSKVKVGGIAGYNEPPSGLRIRLQDSYGNMDDASIVKDLAFTRELVGVGSSTSEQAANLAKSLSALVKELGAGEKAVVKMRLHFSDAEILNAAVSTLEKELGAINFPISAVRVPALPRDARVGVWAIIHA